VKHWDAGKWLMVAAVIVSMPRWAGAFISADVETLPGLVSQGLNTLNITAGLAMGILEVAAAAYMLEAWGRMKPKATWNAKSYSHRWKILTGFIVGLFVLMPFILSPYMVARMTGQTVADVLHYTSLMYAWSVAVVLAPAFVIGGVAIARDAASTEPAPKPAQKAQSEIKPAPEPAPASISQLVCQQCEKPFGSVQALNAHHRWCAGTPMVAGSNGHAK
jgi:hypothetical protein